MSSIVLSALHQNTQQCIEIASIIEASGHTAHFITDDSYTSSSLPKDTTLFLNSVVNNYESQIILEKPFVEHIYKRDRFIKKRISLNEFYKISNQWAIDLHQYFVKNNTSLLVIEGTPAYELVAEHIAQKLNIKIACPAQIFYNGISYGILYSNSIWSDAYILEQKSELLENNGPSIENVVTYQSKTPTLTYRTLNFIKHRSINSPKRFQQFINYISKYFNYLLSYYFSSDISSVTTNHNITFFMHVDPEKSVDNSGSHIWPQFEIIRDFRRRLPVDQQLIVRDHPHRGRYRSFRQVLNIKRLSKNTIYLNGRAPKDVILRKSTGISTISGTIAIEAARLGTPVLCYGKPIYLAHRNVFSLGEYDDFIAATKRSLSTNELQKMNSEFELFLTKRLSSFAFGDVNLLAAANNFDNNASIASSIISVLDTYST